MDSLLTLVGTIVTVRHQRFVVRDEMKKDGAVKLHRTANPYFDKWFIDKVEELPKSIETRLCYQTLNHDSLDSSILAKLGGEVQAETSLAEIWCLLEKQPNGEAGPLLCYPRGNLFFVKDKDGVLRTVCAHYWRGYGWDIYARAVDHPTPWLRYNQVFYRVS